MMTLLQFFLFEIMIIIILRKKNIQNNGMYFLIMAYPIWLVYAYLFCMEVIPFHPSYPRFDGGFRGLIDIIILLVCWVIGMYLISFVMFLMNIFLKNTSPKSIKILSVISMCFLFVFLIWGWIGFYSTPKINNKLFIKSDPTFKVFFTTKFHKNIISENLDKINEIENSEDQQEEILFIQYVLNKVDVKN